MQTIEHFKIKAVIFDLDGTLIDSAPSILAGLNMAIKKSGLLPVLPLTRSLVGPPLRETIQKLVGNQLNVDLDILVSDFKSYYDSEGFKTSILYPGVQRLLNELNQLGILIYLATNKRLEPTLKIVEYFGWTSIFDEIYAIDKYKESPFMDKASMIEALMRTKSIKQEHAIYVGDRIEDFEASSANGLNTILVNWGYGNLVDVNTPEGLRYASCSRDLLGMIMGE